tara:strand:+ start:646 stop:1311 length:666 start_codon:yes stop_codon:yes gene_type:complete
MTNLEVIKEEVVPGSQKLYIIFGGIASGVGMPPFEFYRASKILDETRIFVRDVQQVWYHAGLPGFSTNIRDTACYLERLIDKHSPDSVIMVGNSMGGFAAILFSHMVSNARAVAFAPQTFISPVRRFLVRDRRWRSNIIKAYQKSWNSPRCWDLGRLKSKAGWSVQIHVSILDRLDNLHAQNLRETEGVEINEYSVGGHDLVKNIRDSGKLASILGSQESL